MKFCSKIKYFTNQISGKTFSLLVHRGKPAYTVWYLTLLNVHRMLFVTLMLRSFGLLPQLLHVVFCDITQVRLTCQITNIAKCQPERVS